MLDLDANQLSDAITRHVHMVSLSKAHRTIIVTRQALGYLDEREANNELNARFLGDCALLAGTALDRFPVVTRCCLGTVSASEMSDLMSRNIFPLKWNRSESVK